jgi:transposase
MFRPKAAFRDDVVADRKAFIAKQTGLDPAKLVYIDESGIDTAQSRTSGWAPKGKTPLIERPLHGKRVNLIGAMAQDGVRALRIVEEHVNGSIFLDFLAHDLGPRLKPGDIVVMDGPRIHRVAGVTEILAKFGATPLYLPAYSPELNPIEMAWAWLKKLVRDAPPRVVSVLIQLVTMIWNSLPASLCASWIEHCGYKKST